MAGFASASSGATVLVTVSPATASVPAGAKEQFTAKVTGSTNTQVKWTVNKVAGGNATVGTVSSAGLYKAPAAIPSPAAVTVTATSEANTAEFASATVTVTEPPFVVTVSPATATVQTGATRQFTAIVTGNTNTAVTWTVYDGERGRMLGTITSDGLYTAPAAVPSPATLSVIATSTADADKFGSATVTVVEAPVAVSVVPATATVQPGGTLQFTATVANSTNTAVTWSVNKAAGGSANTGKISAAGLYTAPSAVPSPAIVTVAAKSAADSTKSGAASLTIQAPSGSAAAAGVTDSNGMVTLTSNGLTVPFKLSGQDTGASIAGVAVGLGTDPGVPGRAFLVISDPAGVYPLQILSFAGSATPTSVQARELFIDGAALPAVASATSAAVSSGCPSGTGTTASSVITLKGLKAPPAPLSTQQSQVLLVDALKNLVTLGPGSLPAGTYGPISIAQYPVTSECLKDVGKILGTELAKEAFLVTLGAYVPIVEPAVQTYEMVGMTSLFSEALDTYDKCAYNQPGNPVLNITSVCVGPGAGANNCVLIPQLVSAPEPPSTEQLGQDYAMQPVGVKPAGYSVESYIQSGNLGGIVVGATDSAGTGQVEVPLGGNKVCVDSPGYRQYTNPNLVVSSPPKTIDVTLTPEGKPALTAAPGSLAFTATQGGPSPASQSLTIGSTSGPLNWTVPADPSGVISVVPSKGTTPATVSVSLDTAGWPAGTATGAIPITADGASNSPLSVPVSLDVIAAPCPALTNAWSGTMTQSFEDTNGDEMCVYAGTMDWSLDQTGNSLTGSYYFSDTLTSNNLDVCNPTQGWADTFAGTVKGFSISLIDTPDPFENVFTASLSGETITGTEAGGGATMTYKLTCQPPPGEVRGAGAAVREPPRPPTTPRMDKPPSTTVP
jgi:hypothetical protein